MRPPVLNLRPGEQKVNLFSAVCTFNVCLYREKILNRHGVTFLSAVRMRCRRNEHLPPSFLLSAVTERGAGKAVDDRPPFGGTRVSSPAPHHMPGRRPRNHLRSASGRLYPTPTQPQERRDETSDCALLPIRSEGVLWLLILHAQPSGTSVSEKVSIGRRIEM